MAWTMRGSTNADIEISAANFPQIRFLKLPNVASPTEMDDFPLGKPTDWVGKWQRAVAPEVQNCSAVAYYFARRLHRQLNVPVGIIENSWGGTMAQHWCSKKTLKQIPEMAEDIKKFDEKYQAWIDGGKEEGAKKRLAKDTADWEKKARKQNPREKKSLANQTQTNTRTREMADSPRECLTVHSCQSPIRLLEEYFSIRAKTILSVHLGNRFTGHFLR